MPADTNNESDALREQNPLGKIPTLVLDDGQTLFDSRVILDYLDHLAGGGRIIPSRAGCPFRGACGCRRYATASWMHRSCRSMRRAIGRKPIRHRHGSTFRPARLRARLAALEAEQQALDPVPHVGQITLACALGYQDLRFGGIWRKSYPQLVAWLDRFAAQVPAFEQTRVTA